MKPTFLVVQTEVGEHIEPRQLFNTLSVKITNDLLSNFEFANCSELHLEDRVANEELLIYVIDDGKSNSVLKSTYEITTVGFFAKGVEIFKLEGLNECSCDTAITVCLKAYNKHVEENYPRKVRIK